MALAAHWFPNFETVMGGKLANLTSDALTVGLIASGTFTWGATPEGYQFVSQFLAGDGTHGALTEVATGGGTNYTRQQLTSVTLTKSGEVVTLTAANPLWTGANFSTVYGFLYDASIGSADSSHPIILYWDFNGAQNPANVPFQLIIPAGGLLTWTGN